ncbi:MAG TPA: hypothetical protein VMJ64_00610 [Anaerolineales bacterium]|jgi:hypothetical protein|nr:hypothetical protein [Anaerolineales bacterium]
MSRTLDRNTIIAVALCATFFTGCATQQGNDQLKGAGAGLLGGAALGCLTGFIASGHASGCATGAAIGAATGAVVGWGAVRLSQYQAEQVRSAQDDQRLYGLSKPVDSTQVKIRKGTATPNTVRPGETVRVATDYSVILPQNMQSAPVSEGWTLKKDGKVLADLPQQNNQRTSGGWSADASIPIPTNAQPGTYVIEHKVQAGTSYDTDDSFFIVSR